MKCGGVWRQNATGQMLLYLRCSRGPPVAPPVAFCYTGHNQLMGILCVPFDVQLPVAAGNCNAMQNAPNVLSIN